MTTARRALSLLSVTGFLVGGLIGFLARPSAFLIGQLPLKHVITRGGNLEGMDQILIPLAERSFNFMLIGAVLGATVGAVLAIFVARRTS